jgi:acetyl-CoA carboxylase biotin carboxyl carrier protein
MNEDIRRQVLDMMNRHGIGLLEYEGPEGSLRLDAERSVQDHPDIFAPAPGKFLWRHPTESVEPIWPRHVSKGDVIGWLKVGPILLPVLANENAMIKKPMLADKSLAGYGTRLF